MKKSHLFLFICGILMLISEIWKQYILTFIIGQGVYDLWYFPFQLCSIPMYICLFLPWLKNSHLQNIFASFLADYGLLSGIFSFFDTSGMHYGYAPLTLHSYLWHVLLILIGIVTALSFPFFQRWKYFSGSTALFLICCSIALALDLCLDSYGPINMFYINPDYPMSQRVFSSIADMLGNTAGILLYIASIILGASVFHFIWQRITLHPAGPGS